LSISRLDSGPHKPAVLEGQWRLLDRNGKLHDTRPVRLEEPHQGGMADQIRAQSVLLQRLAAQLTGAIEPLSRQIVASGKARRAERQPPAPQTPTVDPIRTDLEIYRFWLTATSSACSHLVRGSGSVGAASAAITLSDAAQQSRPKPLLRLAPT